MCMHDELRAKPSRRYRIWIERCELRTRIDLLERTSVLRSSSTNVVPRVRAVAEGVELSRTLRFVRVVVSDGIAGCWGSHM